MMSKINYFLLLVVILLMSILIVPMSFGDNYSLEDVRIARDAFAAHQSSIRTWRGQADLSHSLNKRPTDGDASVIDRPGRFEFVYDKLGGRHRSNWYPVADDGSAEPYSEMKLPDAFLRFDTAGRDADGNNRRALFVEPIERYASNKHDRSFVPNEIFSPGGRDMYAYLDVMINLPESERTQVLSSKREDSLLVITIDSQSTVADYFFDSAKDYVLVKYHSQSSVDDTSAIHTWDYDNQDGVWVPARWNMEVNAASTSGTNQLSRSLEFTSQEVNTPVYDEEFSPEAMGVKHGDWVMDPLIGYRYSYGAQDEIDGLSGLASLNDMKGSLSHEGLLEETPRQPDPSERIVQSDSVTPENQLASSLHWNKYKILVIPVMMVLCLIAVYFYTRKLA